MQFVRYIYIFILRFFNICIVFLVLRKLQDFESPFITYKYMSSAGAVIVLRKSYWDTTYDLELLNDPVALKLLYIQAVSEIRSKWIPVTKEVQHRLENLQKSENMKEVRLLRKNDETFNFACMFLISVCECSTLFKVLWLRTICAMLL